MSGDNREPRPGLLQLPVGAFFRQQYIDFSNSFTTIQTNEPPSDQKQDRLTRANRLAEMSGDIGAALEDQADQPMTVHLLVAHQAVVEAFTGSQFAGDGQIKMNQLFIMLDNTRRIVREMPRARHWGTSETTQTEHTVSSFLNEQIENLTGEGNLKLAREFYEALQHTFQGLEDKIASPVLRAAITTVGRDVRDGDLPNLYHALNVFSALVTSGTEALNRMSGTSKS